MFIFALNSHQIQNVMILIHFNILIGRVNARSDLSMVVSLMNALKESGDFPNAVVVRQQHFKQKEHSAL